MNEPDTAAPAVTHKGSADISTTESRNILYAKAHTRIEAAFRCFPGQLYYEGTCALCGDTFKASNSNARYCSQRCVNDVGMARRKLRVQASHKKTCQHCLDNFTATRRDAKFCSAKCKQAAHRVTHNTSANIGGTGSRNG